MARPEIFIPEKESVKGRIPTFPASGEGIKVKNYKAKLDDPNGKQLKSEIQQKEN